MVGRLLTSFAAVGICEFVLGIDLPWYGWATVGGLYALVEPLINRRPKGD